MAKLSAGEIASYAKGAGLSKDVDIAVAIALAESGGRTDAHNGVPPDDSYGLWQINMLGSMGPARRKEFGLSRNDDLYNPATNAKAMMKISNGGTNWRPWTTYTRGTYKLHLNQARTGAGSSEGATVPVGVPSSLSELADKLSDSHFWARIGMYVLGFIFIVVGVVLIVSSGKVRSVAEVVDKVTAA